MFKKLSSLVLGFFLIATPALVQAQESGNSDDWKWSGHLYLWAAGIDAKTQSGIDVDVGFSDLASNLDMFFMGGVQARKSKYSFLADIIYLDVSADKGATVPIGPGVPVNADVGLSGWVLNLLGGYSLQSTNDGNLDFVYGARYLDVDTSFSLTAVELPPAGLSIKITDDVWDAVVGFRGRVNLSDKWFLPYYADVGTGQSELTWQALFGVARKFNWGNIALDYRVIKWELDSNAALAEMKFSGPGMRFNFNFN